MPLMKLLITAILSWLVGLAELLVPFCVSNGELDLTLRGAPAAGSLVSAALLFALLNAPALYWLKSWERGRRASAGQLPTACALILNAPVFLLAAFLAGRTLPFERAVLFIAALIIVSIAFGLGFVWSLPKQ
jgi:hypothetical protein